MTLTGRTLRGDARSSRVDDHDELQLRFAGGGVGGPFTLRSRTLRGDSITTGTQEVTTVDDLQLNFVGGGGGGGGGGVVGGPLTLRGRMQRGDAR